MDVSEERFNQLKENSQARALINSHLATSKINDIDELEPVYRTSIAVMMGLYESSQLDYVELETKDKINRILNSGTSLQEISPELNKKWMSDLLPQYEDNFPEIVEATGWFAVGAVSTVLLATSPLAVPVGISIACAGYVWSTINTTDNQGANIRHVRDRRRAINMAHTLISGTYVLASHGWESSNFRSLFSDTQVAEGLFVPIDPAYMEAKPALGQPLQSVLEQDSDEGDLDLLNVDSFLNQLLSNYEFSLGISNTDSPEDGQGTVPVVGPAERLRLMNKQYASNRNIFELGVIASKHLLHDEKLGDFFNVSLKVNDIAYAIELANTVPGVTGLETVNSVALGAVAINSILNKNNGPTFEEVAVKYFKAILAQLQRIEQSLNQVQYNQIRILNEIRSIMVELHDLKRLTRARFDTLEELLEYNLAFYVSQEQEKAKNEFVSDIKDAFIHINESEKPKLGIKTAAAYGCLTAKEPIFNHFTNRRDALYTLIEKGVPFTQLLSFFPVKDADELCSFTEWLRGADAFTKLIFASGEDPSVYEAYFVDFRKCGDDIERAITRLLDEKVIMDIAWKTSDALKDIQKYFSNVVDSVKSEHWKQRAPSTVFPNTATPDLNFLPIKIDSADGPIVNRTPRRHGTVVSTRVVATSDHTKYIDVERNIEDLDISKYITYKGASPIGDWHPYLPQSSPMRYFTNGGNFNMHYAVGPSKGNLFRKADIFLQYFQLKDKTIEELNRDGPYGGGGGGDWRDGGGRDWPVYYDPVISCEYRFGKLEGGFVKHPQSYKDICREIEEYANKSRDFVVEKIEKQIKAAHNDLNVFHGYHELSAQIALLLSVASWRYSEKTVDVKAVYDSISFDALLNRFEEAKEEAIKSESSTELEKLFKEVSEKLRWRIIGMCEELVRKIDETTSTPAVMFVQMLLDSASKRLN